MSTEAGRILVVDDDAGARDMLQQLLEQAKHQVISRSSAEEALAEIEQGDLDLVLADVQLQGMDGIELCSRVVETRPDVPVIVITGYGSLDVAVSAIRAGAHDFVTKPVDPDALLHAVRRALHYRRLESEVKQLRRVASHRFDEMVGASPRMHRVFDLIARAAESDAAVVITGESGTGKELVARALHRGSPRKNGPFVAVDCASIPATMLESELFGHVRGAFTDAKSDRRGLFIQAHGGTLFLDEIGDMPLEMQAKLLRALQERRVRPVGADTEMAFDARLVAATNRDLESDVTERRFRSDLYYRINVVRIELPPLRARGNDVLELAQHFLSQAAERSGKQVDGFVHAAAEKLLSYDWPGNVRELSNCIEGAVALATHDKITLDDLPERIRTHRVSQLVTLSNDPEDLVTLEELERRYITRVLAAVSGNKTRAAKILGLERRTLYRKLERFAEKERQPSSPSPSPSASSPAVSLPADY